MLSLRHFTYYWRKLYASLTFIPQETSVRFLMFVNLKLSSKKIAPIWFVRSVLDALNKRIGDRFVEFELTNICNARCIFCPYPALLKTDKKFVRMEQETFHTSLEKIGEMDYSLVSFTPTTGDTLLHPDWDKMIAEALKLDKIKQVIFYSNAILLNEECTENFIELLKNDKDKKFFSILFSVGGIDKETYQKIFQVNKFDEVVKQINHFVKRLKEENIKVAVGIKMRAPSTQEISKKQISTLYNKAQYPYFFVDNNKYFEISDHLEKYKEFEYSKNIENKEKACVYLHKTRFAADGGLWADGCVLSEIKNDKSLYLGTVTDNLSSIEDNRNTIITNWEGKGEIPTTCESCSIYKARR